MIKPKLSIVVSTYNRGKEYLEKCLESILFQEEFEDFEVIVVDDASTDNTEEIVNSFYDARIRYVKRSTNFGSDTRPKNEGAALAKGKYLMFVDDDVCLRPQALRRLYRYLRDNPECDVAYGDMWMKPTDEPGIAFNFDHQLLLIRNFIDTSAAMMKKSSFDYVQGFDETLPKFVDWNLFVRMSKAGFTFHRVKAYTFDYYLHPSMKSRRVQTEMYMHPDLGMIYVPTFDPAGCYIQWKNRKEPKVGIFTIHYDRLQYSMDTFEQMNDTAGYPFQWWAVDNGSQDKTPYFLKQVCKYRNILFETNQGISGASNAVLDRMKPYHYDIIIKIDNDVEFHTMDWLKDIVDLYQRNHLLYISPYVEGLIHNPGGSPRIGRGMIGEDYIEVTQHIGGIFAAIAGKAYDTFRWADRVLHGNQDMEASQAFRKMGYMPMYLPKHRITHKDTTEEQYKKYPEYFARRKHEKTTTV